LFGFAGTPVGQLYIGELECRLQQTAALAGAWWSDDQNACVLIEDLPQSDGVAPRPFRSFVR
jgi:hypothetical protein